MKLHNPSAGEILNEEFIIPLGINQSSLSRSLGCNRSHINHIIRKNMKISESLDKRLCEFFKLSQGYFLGLQNDYLKEERKNGK